MDILIVTSRPEQWAPVLPVMEGRGAAVRQAGSLEQGMELVRQQAPALAVLDLGLEPEELRKAVIDILMVNAMIHTAAVSPMTAAEFHDKMEGLGMLMSLPVDFTVRDVEKMMTALEGLAGSRPVELIAGDPLSGCRPGRIPFAFFAGTVGSCCG